MNKCLKIFALVCAVVCILHEANRNARAESNTVIDPPQRLLVVAEKSRTMAGNDSIGKVPRGAIIKVTLSNANWRYSPEVKGWIHVRDTIPLERAITELDARIMKEPSATLHQLRGIVWMSREQWAKASQDFEKAYELGDSSTYLHHNLGLCYERLGESQAAMEEFDSILKVYPDEFPTLLARGNLLTQERQFVAALRDLDAAAKLKARSSDVHNSRGITLRMLERYPDALEAYSTALEINPNRADSLCNRGFVKKNLGDHQGAFADYEAALKIAPTSSSVRNDLAWLLATSTVESVKNPKRAVELAEAVCIESANRDADYLDTLAAAFASDGRFDAAVESAKLAITLQTDAEEAAQMKQRLELYEKKQPYLEQAEVGVKALRPARIPVEE
ncbi:tetratricopeptide repeat protein [Planctomicrobium sp. SH527]|uniref:tetratricopeptide repeat protein n=1 Tax=Planctomicrobium sp. SH527 TaxID=3448123 RepID=UPI003F5C9960